MRDFHKICRFCTSFPDAFGVKIWLDLLKGLWSYGGFNLRGLVTPKFSAPPNGETMRQTPKSFRGARMCSRSFITLPSLVGLTLSFLSVCLSFMLLNVRVCAPDFAMKALEYRNDFDALDRGRLVDVHPCSTFSDSRQVASLNAEVQKRQNWGFFATE